MNRDIPCDMWEYLRYDKRSGNFYWIKTVNSRSVVGSIAGCASGGHCQHIRIRFRGELWQAHTLAWRFVCGEFPEHEIDHRNLDGLDNRLANLRLASPSLNCLNRRKSSRNTSGYKNVSFDKKRNLWRVRMKTIEGRRIDIGFFNDLEAAAKAAIEARNRYHGAFARHI